MIGRRLTLLGGLALCASAAAQPAAPDRRPPGDKSASITVGGRNLQASVATLRLANPQGVAQAEVVTTAFCLAGADPATRPLTFALNGGPGAASAWLDLGAIGPWRVPFGAPSEPPVPQENGQTWLDFTDLVFIDPPGTGYSRIVATGDEVRRQIYGVDGDIELLAVVVRRWLEANGRFASPKFIVGESYGGFRGPKLARALLDRQGVGIAGLVLISPVLDFNARDTAWDPMRFVRTLPSMAAVVRGATSRADVADVEAYATGEFLQDILRGESDPAAVERLVQRVTAITGLDPGLVRRRAGRVDTASFLKERQPGRVGSPYDGAVAALDPFPSDPYDHSPDPILDGMRGPLTPAMLALYAQRLQWQPEGAPERQYEILSNSVASQWDYGRHNARPESYSDLRQYLAVDPSTRVLVVHGIDDLVTPYFGTKLLLDQTPPFAAGRLSLLVTPGGHMLYASDTARGQLHDGAAALVRE